MPNRAVLRQQVGILGRLKVPKRGICSGILDSMEFNNNNNNDTDNNDSNNNITINIHHKNNSEINFNNNYDINRNNTDDNISINSTVLITVKNMVWGTSVMVMLMMMTLMTTVTHDSMVLGYIHNGNPGNGVWGTSIVGAPIMTAE